MVSISFSFEIKFKTEEDFNKAVGFFDDKNIAKLKKENKIDKEMIEIVEMMCFRKDALTIDGDEGDCAYIYSDDCLGTLLELLVARTENIDFTAESLCVQEDEGVGEKTKYWFENGKMKYEYEFGEEVFESVHDDESWAPEMKLEGVNIAVTGRLKYFDNRDDFADAVKEYGGKVASGVTEKVNYLVTNTPDSNSSKNKKAKELGVEVITEEDFLLKYGLNSYLEDDCDEDDYDEDEE